MDINQLLKGVDCACGRRHECAIDSVFIGHGAASHFTELCENYKNILLVADANTYAAAGELVTSALSEKSINRVLFGKNVLIPDENAIETVESALGDAELIIGIGSGVIQDLCKYVSKDKAVPYMVCATAPSMDGYASTGAAMILKGMKETVPAGVPKAIVAPTEVLSSAPMEMIKAGYGDIIGKYSALNDWKLSREINEEYFCEYIYDLTYEMIEKTIGLSSSIVSRDEESVGTLMEALVIVGILMSFASSSRPASGSEHHLSHFFEITGIVDSKPYLPHGIDVAYSTVITAKIREKLVNTPFPEARYAEDDYKNAMKRVYSSVADECMALQERVGNYKNDRTALYKKKEETIKEILKEMPSSDEIKKLLSAVGLDIKEFYDMYGDEKIETAVKYAKDLKDRYTVLWLNYDLFGGKINE